MSGRKIIHFRGKNLLIVVMVVSFTCSGLFAQEKQHKMTYQWPGTAAWTPAMVDSMIRQRYAQSAANPDSALIHIQQLYEKARAINFYKGMANALMHMGMIHITQTNEPRKALDYLWHAYQYYPYFSDKRTDWIIHWNNDMGAAYFLLGVHDSAMLYFSKALQTAIVYDWSDKRSMVMMYNNITVMLLSIKDYPKAEFYNRNAELLGTREKSNAELVFTYQNKADILLKHQKIDSALLYMHKVETMGLPLEGSAAERQEMLYGLVYLGRDELDKALYYARKTLERNVNNDVRVTHLTNIAAVYEMMSDYKNAVAYFNEALQLAIQRGFPEKNKQALSLIYGSLANVYDSLGDYKKAYTYKSLLSDLKDSMYNPEKERSIHRLETQYRTTEKDKEIVKKQVQLLSARNRINQNNFWIALVVSGSLILFITAAFIFQIQRLKLQKALARNQQQKINQLNAVLEGEEKERSRIGRQLHDDVMVEFSIAKMNLAFLPKEKPGIELTEAYRNIEKQLNRTGIKLRQTAHNLMPDALLDEGLLTAINYFCIGVRETSGILINFQHFGDLPRLNAELELNLYRIVQELIQNVIKHAFASRALVQLYYRGDSLSITVDDDGIGIDNTQKADNGMGLKSIRARLKAIAGEMEIHHVSPKGTSVHIDVNMVQPLRGKA